MPLPDVPRADSRPPGPAPLTAAEQALLRMLIEGAKNTAASIRLGVSIRTVERRRADALRKLGVDTLVAAARHPLFAQPAGSTSSATPPDDPFATACRDAAAGVAVVDAGGRFLRANAAFCQLLGRSEAQLVTLDLVAVTYPDDRERDAARNRAFFAGEFATFRALKRYVGPEGAAVRVDLTGSLVVGADGRPAGGVAMAVAASGG